LEHTSNIAFELTDCVAYSYIGLLLVLQVNAAIKLRSSEKNLHVAYPQMVSDYDTKRMTKFCQQLPK